MCVTLSMCSAVYVGLLTYSVFFTDIPIGFDTTHLSHAYDVMSAYQRLFFGLALTLRSEKFDILMRRRKRIVRVVDRQVASSYYKDLKTMWS
ncbi:hypothetical protein COOONC_17597 [Cooperia oncophora]